VMRSLSSTGARMLGSDKIFKLTTKRPPLIERSALSVVL
jgi:hypothetical protein